MPGEGLFNLPKISMETDGDVEDNDEVKGHSHAAGAATDQTGKEEEEDEIKCLPPSKRAKLMAGMAIVPSSQVKRHGGGRGKERFRAKKPGAE